MIYLDYAATSPLRGEVLQKMLPYLERNFGNPDSLHSFGREAAYAVTKARDQIAQVLGVNPGEVYFTSGGTEADNWAVRNLGKGSALVSPVEHAAVLSAAPLREDGFALFDADFSGVLSPEKIEQTLTDQTGLVCVMAVNNETGCIQPIKEISALCKSRGVYLFCDCVQAASTQHLKEILRYADAISLSAHKIGGSKGTGALVVKKGVPLKALIAGGEQERSLRGGTLNVAGIVGFAEALTLAQESREEFCRRAEELRSLFEGELKANLKEEIIIDGENRAPNISHITFSKGGEAFLNLLDLKGVAASGGAACSAHAALPSHVLMAMGRSADEAKRGVRFSFGAGTTKEEVLSAAKTVVECFKR